MRRRTARAVRALGTACMFCTVAPGATLRAQGPRDALSRVGAGLFADPQSTPGTESGKGRPALEPVRIGGEVLVSAYAGIGGFLLGRYIGASVGNAIGVTSEDTRERVAHASGVLAGGLTTAGSVFGIGSIGDQTGSFRDAVIGAGAGYVASLAIRWIAMGTSKPGPDSDASDMRWMGAAIEALLPAVGATIAFNSSRRFK